MINTYNINVFLFCMYKKIPLIIYVIQWMDTNMRNNNKWNFSHQNQKGFKIWKIKKKVARIVTNYLSMEMYIPITSIVMYNIKKTDKNPPPKKNTHMQNHYRMDSKRNILGSTAVYIESIIHLCRKYFKYFKHEQNHQDHKNRVLQL